MAASGSGSVCSCVECTHDMRWYRIRVGVKCRGHGKGMVIDVAAARMPAIERRCCLDHRKPGQSLPSRWIQPRSCVLDARAGCVGCAELVRVSIRTNRGSTCGPLCRACACAYCTACTRRADALYRQRRLRAAPLVQRAR